jgi:D-threo-aldose 1-dehydrogenase
MAVVRAALTRGNAVQGTRLGLGCAPLGQLNSLLTNAEGTALLQSAWDGGVRYFDTAPLYGFGLSELRLGAFLREKPRDEFVVTSKVGRVLDARPGGVFDRGIWKGGLREFVPRVRYDGATILRSFEDACTRLGLARIDGLLLHDLDPWHLDAAGRTEAFRQLREDGGWETLRSLRADGRTRALGSGMNSLADADRFLELDLDFFLVAGRLTLLENTASAHPRGPEEAERVKKFIATCKQRGIRLVVGGAFNSGILVTGARPGAKYDYGEAPPAVLRAVQTIQDICAAHSVPMPAAAIQYPLRHPSGIVSSVIPGCDSADMVRQNLAWANFPIPDALWADLRAANIIE